jgi:hypothetical protein
MLTSHVSQHDPAVWNLLIRIPIVLILFVILVQIPILLALRHLAGRRTTTIVLISLILAAQFVILTTIVVANLIHQPSTSQSLFHSTPTPMKLPTPFITESTMSASTSTNGKPTGTTTIPFGTTAARRQPATADLRIASEQSRMPFMDDLRTHMMTLAAGEEATNPLVSALLNEWNHLNMSVPKNASAAWTIVMAIHRAQLGDTLNRLSTPMTSVESVTLWLNSSHSYNLPEALELRMRQWIATARPQGGPITTEDNLQVKPLSHVTVLDHNFLFANTVLFGLLQLALWAVYLYYVIIL